MDEIVNHIDDEGARHISDALRENSTLLDLDIGGKCLLLFLIFSLGLFLRFSGCSSVLFHVYG